MIKKNNYFLLYFLPFYLTSLWEKNISANLTNSQEPEPEPLEKKPRAGAALGKIRSRSRLKKSQEPEPLKNLPAPQPWI